MGFYPAFHRARQLVPFAAQGAFGQVGEGLGVSMTGGQHHKDHPSRDPHAIWVERNKGTSTFIAGTIVRNIGP